MRLTEERREPVEPLDRDMTTTKPTTQRRERGVEFWLVGSTTRCLNSPLPVSDSRTGLPIPCTILNRLPLKAPFGPPAQLSWSDNS
jgi:hypothetical protein